MHWPVRDCLMVEPTESESLDTLDRFVAVMRRIAEEAAEDTGRMHAAPHHADVARVDEVAAARSPVIVWRP